MVTIEQYKQLLERLEYQLAHPEIYYVYPDDVYSSGQGDIRTFEQEIQLLKDTIQAMESGQQAPNPDDYNDQYIPPDTTLTDYFVLSPSGSNVDVSGCIILKIRTLEILPLTDEQVRTFQEQGYDVRPSNMTVAEYANSIDEPVRYGGQMINDVDIKQCPVNANPPSEPVEPFPEDPVYTPPPIEFPSLPDDTGTPSDSVLPVLGGGLGFIALIGFGLYLWSKKK